MNAGFPTAIAMIVCTALGALAGFLAARLLAGREVGEGARKSGPASELDAIEVVDATDAADAPATGVGSPEETATVDLVCHPTDAEIDALPPELPLRARRRQRESPPDLRRFDPL